MTFNCQMFNFFFTIIWRTGCFSFFHGETRCHLSGNDLRGTVYLWTVYTLYQTAFSSRSTAGIVNCLPLRVVFHFLKLNNSSILTSNFLDSLIRCRIIHIHVISSEAMDYCNLPGQFTSKWKDVELLVAIILGFVLRKHWSINHSFCLSLDGSVWWFLGWMIVKMTDKNIWIRNLWPHTCGINIQILNNIFPKYH